VFIACPEAGTASKGLKSKRLLPPAPHPLFTLLLYSTEVRNSVFPHPVPGQSGQARFRGRNPGNL
ncbi:MAG: hypothetical protein AVDCRST_MAG56-8088, partial [uncultured Cytophagales bacterium]